MKIHKYRAQFPVVGTTIMKELLVDTADAPRFNDFQSQVVREALDLLFGTEDGILLGLEGMDEDDQYEVTEEQMAEIKQSPQYKAALARAIDHVTNRTRLETRVRE